MMRLLNAEPENYSPEAKNILHPFFKIDEAQLTREQLIKAIVLYDIIIVRLKYNIDKQIIDAGSKLRAIVTATTGLDHIDVEYASSKGVSVLSLKGETDFLQAIPSTAEHTWALLLSLIRKIPFAFKSVKKGSWERNEFRGSNLSGKVLGIVGYGRVGSQVAKFGLSFGMKVISYSLGHYKVMPNVIIKPSLKSLLAESDIVTLHVPFNVHTNSMISGPEFNQMKNNVIIINTSRGEIIDTKVLYTKLIDNKISGAALDVLPDERHHNKYNDKLILYSSKNTNLIITPHIAGATIESMIATEIFMARKLLKFMKSV